MSRFNHKPRPEAGPPVTHRPIEWQGALVAVAAARLRQARSLRARARLAGLESAGQLPLPGLTLEVAPPERVVEVPAPTIELELSVEERLLVELFD